MNKEQMKVEIRTIGPDAAKEILKKNVFNRPVSKNHIRSLADQMLKGLWMFDGNPIVLSQGGRLLNGQHRLNAVIVSESYIDFLVVTGVDTEAFKVMDTGKIRSTADVVAIDGVDRAADVASVARAVMGYDREGYFKIRNREKFTPFSNSEVLDFVQKNAEGITKSIEFVYKFKKPLIPKVKVATFHYLFSRIHSQDADTFISKFCTGLDLHETSPIYKLREKLIIDSSSKTKIPIWHKYALFAQVWNKYRKGVSVQHLVVTSSEFPKLI